jgi:hypothetical protein
MSKSLRDLRSLPTTDLIKLHDELAENTEVGISYYLEELARRDQADSTAKLVKLTGWIAAMTLVMLLATAVNVALFALN